MINVYIDGSSKGNPGSGGAGVVIGTGDEILSLHGIPLGHVTNNQAEFLALKHALTQLKEQLLSGSPTCLRARLPGRGQDAQADQHPYRFDPRGGNFFPELEGQGEPRPGSGDQSDPERLPSSDLHLRKRTQRRSGERACGFASAGSG